MNVENYFHIALLRPAPVTVPPLSQCSSHATRVMSKSRAPKCEQEQNIFPHQAFVTQLPLSCVSQRSCNQCACSVVMYLAYPKLVSSNQNDEEEKKIGSQVRLWPGKTYCCAPVENTSQQSACIYFATLLQPVQHRKVENLSLRVLHFQIRAAFQYPPVIG